MSDNRAIGYEKQTAEMNSPKGKNYFFGIGIDTYPEFRHLQNAVKDVNDIYNYLVADFDYESLGILANHQATRTAIIDGLRALRKNALLTENDKLLIYFAGHGKPDEYDSDRGFWIPYNGERKSEGNLISNADLRDIIQSISKPKHILLVCDCCFGRSILKRSENDMANYALEQNELNRSRQIFCSWFGEVADKGKKETNSPFAASILRHLKNLNENAIAATKLKVLMSDDVDYNFRHTVKIEVLKDWNHQLGGDFIFYKQ